MRRPSSVPGRSRANGSSNSLSTGRDLVDAITDAWRTVAPELGRPEFALSKRATRLAMLLQSELISRLAPWGLTKADYNVLSTLRSVGTPYELRHSDLRARLVLSSGGTTNVLNRLEKLDLIERERSTSDARSSWVRLTKAGFDTADQTVRAWAKAQADIYRAVPPEVSRAASDALRQVLLALGDHEPAVAPRRARGAPPRSTPSTTPSRTRA
jgi:DNA-binding MarR family transcriptional regulator